MATYQFSALSDGQAISFNPTVDRLNFDQTTIAAGDLSLVNDGSGGVRVVVKSGPVAGKDVVLLGTDHTQIATTNFTFADGSLALIGDNQPLNNTDHLANALTGGAGRDLLMGLGGNDTLNGADNNDSLVGGLGNDAVNGNNGNDWLEGNEGNDALTGSGGQDSFVFRESGAANADTLPDFASNWDRIELDAAGFGAIGAAGRFASGDARFFAGTAAHDADDRIIYNSATGQIWYDADGNGSGAQQLIATLGAGRGVVATDFTVIGSATPPSGGTINGTAGDDTLIGTPGNDTINGLAGNDSIRGGEGIDSMNGGDGNDTLDGYNHRTFDTDTDVETLVGGLGNDVFKVDNAGDVVSDTGGIDTVFAGNISWTLASGFENLVLDNDESTQIGRGNELNNVIGQLDHGWMMRLEGLAGDDTLFGGFQNDTLLGGDGNDSLEGGEDIDTLDGGAGNDTLGYAGGFGDDDMWGGSGADHFEVATPGQGIANRVHDFETGVDKLRLDGDRMAGTGASGNFSINDARFFAGTAAHDADDRVIWDGSSLWYDPDGTGSAVQERVAIVTGSVVATDIEVVNGSGGGGGGSTINGGPGDDTLNGTPFDDTINGFGGNDSIFGNEGADSLNGGDGNDTLDAWTFGTGDGVVDTLSGGLGNDVYMVHNDGGGIQDLILADPGGIDTVKVLNGSWTLAADLENLDLDDSRGIGADGTGNALANVIRSASEGGTLSGLGGNDTLIGRNAQNTVNLDGGDGNDTLIGGWHTDFDGGAGNDLIMNSGAGDEMTGGTGADIFHFNFAAGDFITDFASGSDKIRLDGTNFTAIGASGNFSAGDARFFAGTAAHDADDRVIFDASTGLLWYDADGNGSGSAALLAQVTGSVVATDITVLNGTAGGGTINGTPGNDSLVGGAGNDTINGNAGNDTLRGLGGDDSLDGGSGADLLDGGLGNDFYVVTTGDSLTDAGGTDTVVALNDWSLGGGFENLILATSARNGSGNSLANNIEGNASNNVLRAREGNDTITGGGGSDFFDFVTAPSAANADLITDFVSGTDRLRFEDAAHAGIGATGNWAATDGRFWAAAGATAGHDANDRVIYNTSTGAVYYDADGSGAGAAQLVATLQGAPTLAATDISVI